MDKIIEFYNTMQDITYGFLDLNNNRHYKLDKSIFIKEYRLQTPYEVRKNKLGICWDQVELERCFFDKNNIKYQTIFIIDNDQKRYTNHTFLIFYYDNKCYWFENTYTTKGIIKFNSLKECLSKVKEEFIKENKLNNPDIYLYEYEKPKDHLSCIEFINHAKNGKLLKDLN